MDKDLKNMTIDQLTQLAESLGGKRFFAQYIFTFIHTKFADDIDDIKPLSKAFRENLKDAGFHISKLQITEKMTDPDGTVKYLFTLPDGNAVEAVLIFDDNRKTLCISSQAGCAYGCKFCATGKNGFKKNLTAGQIIDEVIAVKADKCSPTNVVFMGMGEPMANYDNVMQAVQILNHPKAHNIGLRKITVSTCGIIEGIRKLTNAPLQPRLAVSLNAPNDELRTNLMPVNRANPLKKLFAALKDYQYVTKNRVTFEYILLGGINDTNADAAQLAKLIRPINCNINLICFNPHELSTFRPPSENQLRKFYNILTRAGIKTAIRARKGASINAACGQLAGKKAKRANE